MSKSIHELATEVIAKVIDLEKEQALQYIDKECKDNNELKKAVLELYIGMFPEHEENGGRDVDKKLFTSRRVDRGDKITAFVFQKWFQKVFENRSVKFLFLSIFLFLLLAIGVSVRFQVRHLLLEDTGAYLEDQLYTQQLRLQEWIEKGETTIESIAADPVVVNIARVVDSLQQTDASLETLRSPELIKQLQNEYRLASSFTKVPTGIISKEGARIIGGLYGDRVLVKPVAGVRLGKGLYDAYLDAMDETIFVKPLSSEETIYKFSDSTNSQVVCVFFTPIFDTNNALLGVLYNTYFANREFSQILTRMHVGQHGETYAFDKNGRMLTSGRFVEQLRELPYYGLANNDETIYNILLKDPGVDVSKGIIPKEPISQLPFVAPLQNILISLDKQPLKSILFSENQRIYRNYRGKRVIGRWVWWSEYDFGVLTETNLKDALSTLRFFDYAFTVLYIIIFALSYWLFTSNVKIFRFGKKLEDYKQLGQYKLLEKLGEGGFGEVYKAEHAFLKTPVAIKLLKKQFNGTDMLDRFEKEVKVTASLSHPNTVKVFDYGTTRQGQFYYVMEYLNGVPIDQLVAKEKSVEIARVIHILLGVCNSLQEAHKYGLIHRDIKPMNVMLCNQGGAYDIVKVLDFGLVKSVDTKIAEHTQVNRIGGTPMFMAPERLRDPFNANQKVDVYSIGALGIYMCSGKYVLEIVSQQMLSGEVTLQGDFKQGLMRDTAMPDELRELFIQCLSFDPGKRPDNMTKIIMVLEALSVQYPWKKAEAEVWWRNYDVYS